MKTDRPVALVTGGARRIGKAIVEDLAANGFAVGIHSNSSQDEANALLELIQAAGGSGCVVCADLGDSGAVRRLIPDVANALGPVQLLVNNASVFHEDGIGHLGDDAIWEQHFAIHVKAPVLLADAMALALPAGADGLIVNMIDHRVWKLNPKFMSYTLSKAALWTATRTLAQTLAPRIRVNGIGPGPSLPSSRQDQAEFDRQVAALLLQHGPDLAEFGRTIRYLWEARSVTGQMIALDGGQHLAWETPDVSGIRE